MIQQAEKIKLLIARGKEEGYLTYTDIKEHLPDTLKPEQIEDVISKIKELGIKVEDVVTEVIDQDAEDIINMLHFMGNTTPDSDDNSGMVEVRDNSIWITHIHNNDELTHFLHSLEENSSVDLEINGTPMHWVKMSNGRDGRRTNGIKPIGASKDYWSKMLLEHRNKTVKIKKL